MSGLVPVSTEFSRSDESGDEKAAPFLHEVRERVAYVIGNLQKIFHGILLSSASRTWVILMLVVRIYCNYQELCKNARYFVDALNRCRL